MSNNIYLLLNVKENGKLYAWAYKTSANNDLLSVLARFKNLHTVNVCRTFTEAKQTAAAWNETYKQNGTYLFDNPSF